MGLATVRGDGTLTVAAAQICLQYPFSDPEGWFSVCLTLVRAKEAARAVAALRRTVSGGFACFPGLSGDPTLRVLYELADFEPLRAEVEQRRLRTAREFETSGGRDLLA